jgi:hypothetical protein
MARARDKAMIIGLLDTEALGKRVAALLSGHPPERQGAVLADMTATWVAGHIVPDDPKATYEMRRALLKMHFREIAHMIEFHHKRIHGR